MSAKEPSNPNIPNAHGAWGAMISDISRQQIAQNGTVEIKNGDNSVFNSVKQNIYNLFSPTVGPIKDGDPSKKIEGRSTLYGTFSW